MMNGSFDIYDYLSGLTGYVFDISVLKRVALNQGVSEVTDYSELTEEQKDRCKIELLETLLITPHQSASQTNKHGEWQTQTGSQTLTAAVLDNINRELGRLYKKYDEQDKLDAINDGTLQWLE